ncbi:MAG TPA: twin-arginine translocase TatA/TatE family subunit [Rhodospirillales bacterium]|nr:twin-arginine translocase TatA/TatE family subunit [Rhodospirillales bacterium]
MGAFSIWHWLIVLVVVLVLFGGKGKISALMGDFGKGLKSFKKGMKEEESPAGEATSEEAPKVLKTEQSGPVGQADPKEDKAVNS